MNFVQTKFVLKKRRKPSHLLSLSHRQVGPACRHILLPPAGSPSPAPLSPVPSPSAARPFRSTPVPGGLPFPSFTPRHQGPVALYHSPDTPTDGQSAKAVVPTDHQLV